MSRPARFAVSALAVALCALATAWAAGLTPAEERGRRIYRAGAGTAEITAVLSSGGVELPASSMPCVGCHGRDGRGRPEGGVAPSNVTWESLTKPGSTPPGGRPHPPYTERLLKRAITLGLDPAGNALHVAMPRYRLSQSDAEDLIAYLKRLGNEPEPGVTDIAVRVGYLPSPGQDGAAVRALLGAWLEELSRRGDIYGRRIELVPLDAAGGGDPSARRARMAEALDRSPVFALLGTSFAGPDDELARLFEERELPVIGALSPSPWRTSRYLFYLYSGLEEQGRALLEAAARGQGPKLAVVGLEDDPLGDLAAVIEEDARRRGWKLAASLRYRPGSLDPAALAGALRKAGAETVFLAVPGADQLQLAVAAEELGWRPRLLSPGPLSGAALLDAPARFDGGILLSFPTLPVDQSPAAIAEIDHLARARGLPRRDLPQLSVLAAAKLLAEALNRTGRDLTRERLIETIEKLGRFETGLTRPLAYGPGRRIGARGAYVVVLDLKRKTMTPAGGWVGME